MNIIMNDESVFTARVSAASEDEVSFEDHDSVSLSVINHGQVQIEFNRPKGASDEIDDDMADEDGEED